MLGTIDEWQLVVLMLFGGVFALAGLGLLVYRSSDTTQTHAELFGLKCRISSPGLVVFLVGAAFLAVPLEGVSENTPDRGAGGAAIEGGSNGIIFDKEQEPNNSMPQANGIEFGHVYTAELDSNDTDVFAFKTDELDGRAVRTVLKPLRMEGDAIMVAIRIYNENGQEIFTASTRGEQKELWFNLHSNTNYHLTIALATGTYYRYNFSMHVG